MLNRAKTMCRAAVTLVVLLAISPLAWPATQPPASDLEYRQRARQEFTIFDHSYAHSRAERVKQVRALGKQVFARETAGQPSECSHQILNEIAWYLGYTADFKAVDRRLADLQNTLAHAEMEAKAAEQDPADGSWGACYTQWFFKLDASFDHLRELTAKGERPKYKPRFLDRINSPEKLRAYLTAVSISDIADSGVDHRREFNESLADLLRLILDGAPKGYRLDRGLRPTMMKLIREDFRNPATAWWGERYARDGKLEFVDDISITFHVVRYLNGDVPELAKVGETALAVKDLDYHVGWLEDGQYTNHNNMDAVVLFKYSWPYLDPERKRDLTAEIRKMLDWCLRESLQADGSFKLEPDDQDSAEEQTYFGVAFLSRVGFFDKSARFWTTENFVQAPEVMQGIRSYIVQHQRSGGAGGEYYRNALKLLEPGAHRDP
ncbi:MAG: hypothetical protein WA655_19735 [Candidatus Korobacteraceae bacterium]